MSITFTERNIHEALIFTERMKKSYYSVLRQYTASITTAQLANPKVASSIQSLINTSEHLFATHKFLQEYANLLKEKEKEKESGG